MKKEEIIVEEKIIENNNEQNNNVDEDLPEDAAFRDGFRLLQHSPLAAIRRSEEHAARGESRYNYMRKLRAEIVFIKTMQELLNASALISHEARTTRSTSNLGRVLLRRISHFLWLEQISRLLRPNDAPVYESSIRETLLEDTRRRHLIPKHENIIKSEDGGKLSYEYSPSSLNPAVTSLEMLDDVYFWWKDAGRVSLHAKDVLELVRFVDKDNSPVTRLLKCMFFLSTPPFGSDLGRYVSLFVYRVREHTLNAKFEDEMKEHRRCAKAALNDEIYALLLNRYVECKQHLLRSLEETRAAAWDCNNNNNSKFTHQELRTRILDVMAMGSQLAREQHLLPSKDAEQILTAVHHCLGGCIGHSGATCFAAEDFMDKKTSILPFCFGNISKARQVDVVWADRTLSLVFAWITAFASLNQQSADTDKLVRFALTVAIKQGIPASLIVKSPLLMNGVMSFFGVVSCLSVPILRPVAKMMPAESLRDIFYESSNNNNGSKNELTSTQLVTILPFVALYIPQIAPEVAGALAKRIGNNNTNNNNQNSSSSSSNNSNNSMSGLSAVPSVITLIGDRFRLLCNNKWLEINAEVRELVSNILLADMVDPSMTTQSVQLFTQHADKIPAFFAALFNWGLSDQALARLKVLYDRVPADVKSLQQHQHQHQDGTGAFHYLKFLADSVATFIPESNVRQGAHAERSISIMRAVSDPLVSAALESLSEHTAPQDVWTLFVSVYKLFANACISADVSQRAIATIGVFFKNEERLRSVLVGDGSTNGVENVLFLLRTGTEDSYTSSFLSGSAKTQIAAPLLNVILDQMAKEVEQEAAAMASEVQEFTSVDDLFGSSTNNDDTKNKKKNQKNDDENVDVKKKETTTKDSKLMKMTWKHQHATIFASLITGRFVTSPASIPAQLAPFEITTSAPDQEMRSSVLEWLEVMAACARAVDPTNNNSSNDSNTNAKSKKTKPATTNSGDSNSTEAAVVDTNNSQVAAISDLPPFSQWLRKKAEPYIEFLVDQRAKLPAGDVVRAFAAIDALGLTFPQVLEALSDQTYRLTFRTEQQQEQQQEEIQNTNNGNNNVAKDSLAEIMGTDNNNNNVKEESSSPQQENIVFNAHDDEPNEIVSNRTRLQFVSALANSTVKVLPAQMVSDAMSIIERLQRMESGKLSFDEVVTLGVVAGTLIEKRADVSNQSLLVMHASGANKNNNNNNTNSTFVVNDFASEENKAILTSTIRRVAAAAIIATSTNEIQQQQQQQRTTNKNNNKEKNDDDQNKNDNNASLVATGSLPLTPSQAIGLLRSLSVSGVSQNSVFASLVAVLDQARKSAPLLEADVLSLCSIVADMSKRAAEGKLSATDAADLYVALDIARAAAQDVLAQLLRFLVRSKSLDRVKEFGRLLDAVVGVLSTSIELHTMQELAASAMSRAQRGQLTPADVETILRIITNRLSIAPQLAQQLSRTTLPDLRTHVADKCFPMMSARATCSCLYLIHQCYPLQHCSTADIDLIITAFERRIMDVGKQLDVASITMLCSVYLDLRRSSTVLQHVLKHLASKIDPATVSLKHIRDAATCMIGLKSPHRDAMAFLERRLVQILNEKAAWMQARDTKMPAQLDPSLLAETLAIFSVNRDPLLGDAVAPVLTAVYIPHFTAAQASSVAHSLALLGVRNAATYNRLLSVVYSERRGSLFSNQAVVANLLYVFDTLQREVHPDLYDLITPRRNLM